jgi:hypothetical protein
MAVSKILNKNFEDVINKIETEFNEKTKEQEFVNGITEENDIVKFYQSKLVNYY